MNEQAIGLLIVWAIGVGALVVLLIIFRGFLLWLIGTSDIIRLLEEQNRLLKQSQPDPPTTSTPAPPQSINPEIKKRNPRTLLAFSGCALVAFLFG